MQAGLPMWKMMQANEEQLEAVLYFLCSSLYSALEDSDYLSRNSCQLPELGPGLATTEIVSRLADFRERIWDVGNCEALVVTKILRARQWALELRRYEPHLRADIDAFLQATEVCKGMSERLVPDAHQLFDGDAQPRRFFARRISACGTAESGAQAIEGASPDLSHTYRIGGEVAVDEINDACERLLTRLGEHYGWDEEAEADVLPQVEEQEEPIAADEEVAEKAVSPVVESEVELPMVETSTEHGDELHKDAAVPDGPEEAAPKAVAAG